MSLGRMNSSGGVLNRTDVINLVDIDNDTDDKEDLEDVKPMAIPSSAAAGRRNGTPSAGTNNNSNKRKMVAPVIDIGSSDDSEDDGNQKPAAVSTPPGAPSRKRHRPLDDGDEPVILLDSGSIAKKSPPKSPLSQVLEFFPDADADHVKKLLTEQNGNIELVALIMTSQEYPKCTKTPSSATGHTAAGLSSAPSSSVLIRRKIKTEPKYDYSKANAFEPSSEYKSEAVNQLYYDFPFLKMTPLRDLLRENVTYTMTRRHINNVIVGKTSLAKSIVSATTPAAAAAAAAGTAGVAMSAATSKKVTDVEEEQHYHTLKTLVVKGYIGERAKRRLGNINCVKSPRKKYGIPRAPITDDILADEVYHFDDEFDRWKKGVKEMMRRRADNKIAETNGTAQTCAICYDENIAPSNMISCKEKGHLFCFDCIGQYVDSNVYGNGNLGVDSRTKKPALELLCCDGSGCTSGFRDVDLERILPEKTWYNYGKLQLAAQVATAGLDGEIVTCPKCSYMAFVPGQQMIFDCPIEGCRHASCKKCGHEPHIPYSCDEAEKNREKARREKLKDGGRLRVEEALSQAKMRVCPKCKQKSIKSDGCNKMSCPCGAKFCYICRKQLTGPNPYSHFCQTPHCDHSKCAKCQLYSKDKEDDERAMREAGLSAAAEYKETLEKEGGEAAAAQTDLNLDVEKLMEDPANPSRAARLARRGT